MTKETLDRIIQRRNERLEDNAVDKATRIIDQIAAIRENMLAEGETIKELQAELKSIQVVSLDAKSILGE